MTEARAMNDRDRNRERQRETETIFGHSTSSNPNWNQRLHRMERSKGWEGNTAHANLISIREQEGGNNAME